MNSLRFCLLFLVLGAFGSNTLSAATTLGASMTVDNEFTAYISTDDSVQGTQIGTGNSWPTTYNFNSALTPGVTNYLHIVATDTGAPAMFIGSFTLNNSGFIFDNGTQSLVTNTTNWSVSTTGFGSNYSAPQDLGAQGTAPWGSFAGINAAARFIWHSGGPGNTVYFSTEISPTEAGGGTTRATFTVEKEFTDGNDETAVTVNIQCFTGVPLNQSVTRVASGGDFEVEFVVESFDDGQLDCDVSEDAVAGYSADYEITATNASSNEDDGDACEFEDVNASGDTDEQNVCVITNSPDPVEVEIHKVWLIEGSDGADVDQDYELILTCNNPILGENELDGFWSADFSGTGNSSAGEHTVAVVPDWEGGTSCSVQETVFDDAVESSDDCSGLDVDVADVSVSCTVTNTVFFEGIPTLSQYGMAVLALLLLGVGFAGFRRFV